MAFSADGNEVVAAIDGQKGRYAETWTLATGQLARTIGAAGSSTGSSSFSRVRILDGGARVVTEEVRPAEVGELQDGAHIMTTYELATGKTISRWRVRRPPDDRLLLDQATADAGEAALFGPAGKSVRIVDVGTGDSKRSFDLPPRTGVLALSRDGRLLAALADDGGGSVLDARSGKTLRNLKGAAGSSPMVAFSPDGRWLVAAHWRGTLALWDLRAADGAAPAGTWDLTTRTDRPTSLLFTPDGKRLLVGTGRGLVHQLAIDDTR